MKVFVFSRDVEIEAKLKDLHIDELEIVSISDENKLSTLVNEKCVVLIDMNSFKGHGFVVASNLSHADGKKALIVGVTTLKLDSTDNHCDLFFDSFDDLRNNFSKVLNLYEDA